MTKLIIMYGPTAVGKSDFGEQLARALDGEIINGDIGQCYTPLTIGTAKPDWRHSDIPHHLFDIIDHPKNFTVVEYRHKVLSTIDSIVTRNKIPIVIGGSGFYSKSLFFPPHAAKMCSQKPIYAPELHRWHQLHEIDPQRAQQIHPHDIYRINRALDIYFETGKKASEYLLEYKPIMPFIFLNLNRDRSDLYDRINRRTAQMLKSGWIDEVRQLMETDWKQFLLEKKLIGYDDIIRYLDTDSHDKDALAEIIAQKTRNYAKRQITFGKMLVRELLKHQQENSRLKSHIRTLDLAQGSTDYTEAFQQIKDLL